MTSPLMLLIATMAVYGNAGLAVDVDEAFCLAQNIYFEAGFEPGEGMDAVAHVTLNRVSDSRYPESVCEVVWQKGQFSWTRDGRSDRIPLYDKDDDARDYVFDAWMDSADAAVRALVGLSEDQTGGANFYYAHDVVTPHWRDDFEVSAIIGGHTFMRDLPDG